MKSVGLKTLRQKLTKEEELEGSGVRRGAWRKLRT